MNIPDNCHITSSNADWDISWEAGSFMDDWITELKERVKSDDSIYIRIDDALRDGVYPAIYVNRVLEIIDGMLLVDTDDNNNTEETE